MAAGLLVEGLRRKAQPSGLSAAEWQDLQRLMTAGAALDANLAAVRSQLVRDVAMQAATASGEQRLAQARQAEARQIFAEARQAMLVLGRDIQPAVNPLPAAG